MTKEEEKKIQEELNTAIEKNGKKTKKTAPKKSAAAEGKKDDKSADKKSGETASGRRSSTSKKNGSSQKGASSKKSSASKKKESSTSKKKESSAGTKSSTRKSGSSTSKKSSSSQKSSNKAPEKSEKKTSKEGGSHSKSKGDKHVKAADTKKSSKSDKAQAKPKLVILSEETPEEETKPAGRITRPSIKEGLRRHGAPEIKKMSAGQWALLAALFIAMVLVVIAAARYTKTAQKIANAYIAGTSKDVPVFTIENAESEDGSSPEQASEYERLTRGTPVRLYAENIKIDETSYYRIAADEDNKSPVPDNASEESADAADKPVLYVREADISFSPDDIVREKEVYVRTPATIYAEDKGPAIASFAPKSARYDVTGYDTILPDGSINKYKISYTGADGQPAEGYVYGKYMTDTQEKADAVYNENGIADKVAKDNYGFELHGGKASSLDYYPFEKPVIQGKEFCEYARGMYINCEAAVNYEPWVNLIKETGCNAAVIDIKDGVLAYESDVAKELSPASYKTAYVSKDDYRKGIEAYRDTGVYLIGRIVVFNDPIYAQDHPENCIKYGDSTDWPSGFSRGVWEYNVRLAQEAIAEFGFDEIQFDYVRFPESSYDMSESGEADFRNVYGEEKGQAIQNFCMYAADQIHDAGAYFSVDVFGESAYGYMTAYGQYWAGISNVVDAISAMPYTDHMGVDGAWEDPYGIMNNWGKKAKKQQDKLENPAVARTWITGYDTPHWEPTRVYGTDELSAQVRGLEDAGLTGGFIPWNGVSSIEKYREYKGIWDTGE